MGMAWDAILRTQLVDRRRRLETAIPASGKAAVLVALLREVDSTLEKLGSGRYGECENCHEAIEEDRLLADPLVRTCLGCLTSEQQRTLEQDLDLASRIQGALLPKSRNFAGWEVGFHYEPAGPVSGDYCDLVPDESEAGGMFFFLGDVSGKGVAASLLVSHLHAIFRSLVSLGLSPQQLIQRANRIFCSSTVATHYATLVCGRAHPSGKVEICNAGHCPVLIVTREGVSKVEATGLPIGVFSTGQYTTETSQVEVGDSVFLYTDGVSEAEDGSSDQFGVERLACLLQNTRTLAPQGMIHACLQELVAFRSPSGERDDISIMVIRRVPEPEVC